MPSIANESQGKGGNLILAEIINKTTLWYHMIWRKTCCQKIKCMLYPYIKASPGDQGLQLGAYTCRQIVGRAQYSWICLLPRNDLYQRPWCRQANIEASWHLTNLSAPLLWAAESPRAQHVQLQGERTRGHGSGFNAAWQVKTLWKSFAVCWCHLHPSCHDAPRCLFWSPGGDPAQRGRGNAQRRSGDAWTGSVQVWGALRALSLGSLLAWKRFGYRLSYLDRPNGLLFQSLSKSCTTFPSRPKWPSSVLSTADPVSQQFQFPWVGMSSGSSC